MIDRIRYIFLRFGPLDYLKFFSNSFCQFKSEIIFEIIGTVGQYVYSKNKIS
jgi:hypothetical protein